jgi:hypothetical protein
MTTNPVEVIALMAEIDTPNVAYGLVRIELPHPIKNYAPDEIKDALVQHGRLSKDTLLLTMNSSAARRTLAQLLKVSTLHEKGQDVAIYVNRPQSPDEPAKGEPG